MNAKKNQRNTNDLIFNVIHVDDHELFRIGLKKLLEERAELRVTASIPGGRLKETLKTMPCDVLLLDISMPDEDGLALMKFVKEKYPSVKIIALTMHKDREYFRASISRGANGYILKDDVFTTLIEGITKILAGENYYSAAMNRMVFEEFEIRQNTSNTIHLLTSKEQDILRSIAKGKMNKQIASELLLSVRTIESHRANIMRKLKIKNIQGLVKFAVENALI